MVARLIHRYGVADQAFPGARSASLDDVGPGCMALFSLASCSVKQAHDLTEPAGRALRDAAHLESAAPLASFRHSAAPSAETLIDLGQLRADAQGGSVGAVAAGIVRRGGVPMLLGGSLEAACDAVDGAFVGRAPGSTRCVIVSASLVCARRLCAIPALGPKLVVGAHDLLAADDWRQWHRSQGAVIAAASLVSGHTRDPLRWLRDPAHGRDPTFVILDMGCIDMGHASGSVGDNVGGLDPGEFLVAVEAIGAEVCLAGAAVVELAPTGDFRGHSERLGARALLGLLAVTAARSSLSPT